VHPVTLKPQTRRVLSLLIIQGTDGLTPLQAQSWAKTMRLAARVSELRAAGHRITTTTVKTEQGAHVARYTLAR
jgi:hypothetical protein